MQYDRVRELWHWGKYEEEKHKWVYRITNLSFLLDISSWHGQYKAYLPTDDYCVNDSFIGKTHLS